MVRTAWAQIHVALDNLSAHKTKDVERFLEAHPKVRFHFTQTYSSWLNRVELWFANPAGRDRARRVHLDGRSGQAAAEVHPNLLQVSQGVPLDLHRSQTKNRC